MPDLEKAIQLAHDVANDFMRQLEQHDLHKYQIDRLSGSVNGAMTVYNSLKKMKKDSEDDTKS
jgi:hypothetical protein